MLGTNAEIGTQVYGLGLESRSCWTRDSSPTHSDSTQDMQDFDSSRTGTELENCAAEDSIQVHLTSNVETLESETAIGLPLTRQCRHGYVRYVPLRYALTKYWNISSLWKMPCTRGGNFLLLGTCIRTWATNTWTRTQTCNLLDSGSTRDMQDSDSRKCGLVATLQECNNNTKCKCVLCL